MTVLGKDFHPSYTKELTMTQVQKNICMVFHVSFHLFAFILDEVVAIKAIDMKGVKDAISREML